MYVYISRWFGNQTSLVRRIKTEFQSSLSTETVSSLIGCHFNKRCDANYLYLMSLFLLKESRLLMKEKMVINIIIFKTFVFFVQKNFFLCDDQCG